MKTRVEVQDFCDVRTKAQLESSRACSQAVADMNIEALWRRRVQTNVQARITRKVDAMIASQPFLRAQAS